ncbi:DUF1405 domain-containing protein [Paenibacillus filicis]|uniref:DUF1405 domain-containing protein n=1 Tax=Paenibacillus gyeongsangnamensis TaxID=3388067 RepID=A0ABT4Q7W2_9BACL|nr:DUF1405 domain-containing protein [Paenibacillus filicis]MCZ8512966.1 DUF1405 domain-containing protein [Paenibacillus filicis]
MSAWKLSYYVSRDFLGGRFMLWSLFWINLLGTVYGYIWYGKQLVYTAQEMSPWYLPFVPDSPTASLFFTLVIVYLLFDRYTSGGRQPERSSALRGFVETFALVTSFKYGIWAVSMILASAYQGTPLVWQDWMLMGSHLGMAAEALLYVGFYTYRWPSILLAACWCFWNDYMDYAVGVFPWLPDVLMDELPSVATYTIALSVISIVLSIIYWLIRPAFQPVHRKTV